MPRPLSLIALLAAVVAALAAAAPSPAATPAAPETLLDTAVTAGDAVTASCLTRRAGAATRTLQVREPGYVLASLDARGDWDLALFAPSGRRVAAGVTPGGDEVASAWVAETGRYTVQACRRSGAHRAQLAADLTGLPDQRPKGKAQLVDVKARTRAERNRLTSLGLDLTEHGSTEGLGVVLHGAQDAAKLRRAGFEWEVDVPDLVADGLRERAADRRFARATQRSALPSGRDAYRTLEDYNSEMRALAQKNPGLVKLIELPFKTWEGRTVLGIEITTNVNVEDGKPVFLNMGVHHAREWPSGEHAMEWAYELVNGFKRGDARATRIVKQSRNMVVPIVNPDGFNASRTAGAVGGADGGRDETVPDTLYLVAGAVTGGEYRRKNCRLPTNAEAGNCATSAGLAEPGVDPNRNYGGLWGGPGTDQTNLLAQNYPGPGPFSEPETRNIKALVGGNQVVTLITNHTTAGLVLRAPGLASLGDPVDEDRGYKQLGDDMALQNGYFSQKSFELYDTTGTTEDWSYNSAGGYGFTFELYCGAPNYATGDCDDPAFHPLFATMVKEWTGDSDQSNHVTDPGRSQDNPFGMRPKFNGGGNREAYYIAAESTLNEQRHSIIEGRAPAGATLRIRKSFKTETFPQADGKPIVFDDGLESSIRVGSDGRFRWHTNPSTRPIVAKARGDKGGGKPAPPQRQTGSPAGVDAAADANDDNAALPCASAEAPTPACWNEHRITVPATGDNRSANIRVSWPSPASDYDIKLFEDTNGNGDSDAGDKQVAASENGVSSEEEVGLTGTPKLQAGKRYILRVTNFVGVEPYTVDIRWNGPEPFQPAKVEAWTLTCEVGGKVLQRTSVVVDRGKVARPDLSACIGAAPERCVPANGFRSAKVTPKGRRARFAFKRRVKRPVTVDVFKVSSGRRVRGEILVARFRNRKASFTWNGRANRRGKRVTDGHYFVRMRMTRGRRSIDIRRTAFVRRGGRLRLSKPFYRRDSCGLLRRYKLSRPVFGGTGNRAIEPTFVVGSRSRVGVVVRRGGKVVRRFKTTSRGAGKTHRLRLRRKSLPRGRYAFRITVQRGSRTVRSTLYATKL